MNESILYTVLMALDTILLAYLAKRYKKSQEEEARLNNLNHEQIGLTEQA